jgi:glycosyltransferase involved in cell wall biosynthesis
VSVDGSRAELAMGLGVRVEGSPKVTFGIIVLNGEPFTKYCVRSLYPYAHEIIVVEGASPGGAGIADPDGHSSDGTLAALRQLKADDDPDNKVTIVTAEDEGHADGFWPGEKDEQSRAYCARATGEYLWQVDVDEFYREEDVATVLQMLEHDRSITAVSFKMLTFWGDLGYVADGWPLRRGKDNYHRLFKWEAGYDYVSHRPPTVRDDRGRDTREVNWLDAAATSRVGVRLFHYSLLFPKQVREKGEYYANAAHSSAGAAGWGAWMRDSFLTLEKPYRVHNLRQYPSWLARYDGDHPEQARMMMNDIRSGKVNIDLRPNDDVERLLDSWWYPLGRRGLMVGDYADRAARAARHPRSWLRRHAALHRRRVGR